MHALGCAPYDWDILGVLPIWKSAIAEVSPGALQVGLATVCVRERSIFKGNE